MTGGNGVPLLTERGALSILSFNHLDFHLFNEITKRFLFPVCQALGWVLRYEHDHDLLPPSGVSLGVWEEAVLTDNCPMAGAMQSEAPDPLASREGRSNQTELSNWPLLSISCNNDTVPSPF